RVEDDDHVERGDDDGLLRVEAERSGPSNGLVPIRRTPYPPLIAIAERGLIRLDVFGGRLIYPGRRHDLLAVPGAAVENQLTDFRPVARAQAQPARRRWKAADGVLVPRDIFDPERREDILLSQHIDTLPGDLLQ